MAYYGIEQSTDLRCRQTVIKKFKSKCVALDWKKFSGHYTHDDPEKARNYHHTLRYVYDIKVKINKKDPCFNRYEGGYLYEF